MHADHCPLCDAETPEFFWGDVWSAPGKRVMRCPNCESFFLDPPTTEDEQREFDAGYDRYIGARSELVSTHTDRSFAVLVDESIETRFRDLKQWFEGRPSVLEIGAEKGGFLDRIAPLADQLAAVDSCPEYKGILQAKGYRTYAYVWDLPPNETYDRICLFSLLEHIQRPRPFL